MYINLAADRGLEGRTGGGGDDGGGPLAGHGGSSAAPGTTTGTRWEEEGGGVKRSKTNMVGGRGVWLFSSGAWWPQLKQCRWCE